MITVAHPGRYGDLFWALPTIRALADRHNTLAHLLLPTDPANTTPWAPLVPLLEAQPYIGRATVVPDWSITQDAPRTPRTPPGFPADGIALGYEHWPARALPYEAAELGGCLDAAMYRDREFFRPWIHGNSAEERRTPYPSILVSWTDRYFELKLGILSEIRRLMPGVHVRWYAQEGSRMCEAGAAPVTIPYLADLMAAHTVVLTDCSMAHVLACGLGVPHVLVVEPEPARSHWVFWPGSDVGIDSSGLKTGGFSAHDTEIGRRVQPVLGGDGRPTFDSRHTIDALKLALERS